RLDFGFACIPLHDDDHDFTSAKNIGRPLGRPMLRSLGNLIVNAAPGGDPKITVERVATPPRFGDLDPTIGSSELMLAHERQSSTSYRLDPRREGASVVVPSPLRYLALDRLGHVSSQQLADLIVDCPYQLGTGACDDRLQVLRKLLLQASVGEQIDALKHLHGDLVGKRTPPFIVVWRNRNGWRGRRAWNRLR